MNLRIFTLQIQGGHRLWINSNGKSLQARGLILVHKLHQHDSLSIVLECHVFNFLVSTFNCKISAKCFQ